jgi:DtxR family transcriptional regulator, Mn-dependent transcriptional regulator
MESAIVEEYLEAIYRLQKGEKPLGTTEIGKALSVSPPSADQMTTRMAEKGLVARSRKNGIRLTEIGEKEALRLIRKHRISERFLTDVLGLDWKDVHDEACKFEHILSPEVESRMDAMLRNPATCPHGQPIPDPEGRVTEEPAVPLSDMAQGATVLISRITEEKRDLLEYLATLGMMPGRRVHVEQIAPFKGPMLVRIDGAAYALGRDVAEKILVKEP